MKLHKLVIIGAGSAYTPEIFSELIRRRETLCFERIDLVDIEEGIENAQVVCDFGLRMFQNAGLHTALKLTLDRREALRDADFVISQIRVGGWKARIQDEVAGLELGLLGQETTGVGGFLNAMRTIPVALDIAKDMEECCPKARLVNFTNPSGMVTEAILRYRTIPCIGLCNVPINLQNDAAKVLGVPANQVECTILGLNHLSYMTAATVGHQDVMPRLLEEISQNETLMKNIPKVAGVGELIRRLRLIPSPYLQYFYFEKEMLEKQQAEYAQKGVTRGVSVHAINQTLYEKYRDPSLVQSPPELAERGGSLYSFAAMNIIEAWLSDTPVRMTVNVLNQGAISDLPEEAGVEVDCLVSRHGVERIPMGPLPKQVAGLVKAVKQYESLTVEAAFKKSGRTALWALLNHPLIHGHANGLAVLERLSKLYPEYIILEQEV